MSSRQPPVPSADEDKRPADPDENHLEIELSVFICKFMLEKGEKEDLLAWWHDVTGLHWC